MPLDTNIGDGADALTINQLRDALDGTYWTSGWDATAGTGSFDVDIAAGSGSVDGTDISTGSVSTVDLSGDVDPDDPRKVVIYIDPGGVVQKAVGDPTPAAPTGETRFRTYDPAPPASVSGVVVAEVWLGAGATEVVSGDIRDRRVSNKADENATPNTLDWVEDGNSPQTVTADEDAFASYTLSGTYDIVKMFFRVTSDAAAVDMRLNGYSGSDYTWLNVDGSESTGSEFQFISGSDDTTVSHGELQISGRTDGGPFSVDGSSIDGRAGADSGLVVGRAETGDNVLNTIDFAGSFGNATVEVEVYGRDIA